MDMIKKNHQGNNWEKRYRVAHVVLHFYDELKDAEAKYDEIKESLDSEGETASLGELVKDTCVYGVVKEDYVDDKGQKKNWITYGAEWDKPDGY